MWTLEKKMKKIIIVIMFYTLSTSIQATPIGFGRIIDGTTFDSSNAFQFFNNSTSGEKIVSLTWDLTPIGAFFDSTDTTPGLTSSPLSIGTSSPVGHVFPADTILNGLSELTISFSNFDSGEFFNFGVDTDFLSAPDTNGLNGIDFIGAIATASFSDGSQLTGVYEASGAIGFGSQVDITTKVSTVPVPAAVWLFGSGLIGLFGVRKKSLKAPALSA
jgi:hypothetical protein